MRIITKYPIIKNGMVVANKFYNASGKENVIPYGATLSYKGYPYEKGDYEYDEIYNKYLASIKNSNQKVTKEKKPKKIKDKKYGNVISNFFKGFTQNEKKEVSQPQQDTSQPLNKTNIALISGGALALITVAYLISKK